MENDAWKSAFDIVQGGNGRHWLLVRKNEMFSYNMVIYKTQGGAKKGARAAYNKINKEIENILFSNK